MKLKTIIKIVVGVVIPPVGMVLISIFILNRTPVKHKMKTGIALTVLWSALLLGVYIGSKQDEAEAFDRGITLAELKDERNDKRLAKAAGFETIAEYKADIESNRISEEKERLIREEERRKQKRIDAITVPSGYEIAGDEGNVNYNNAVSSGLQIIFMKDGNYPSSFDISATEAKETACRDINRTFVNFQSELQNNQTKAMFKKNNILMDSLSLCIREYQASTGVHYVSIWRK